MGEWGQGYSHVSYNTLCIQGGVRGSEEMQFKNDCVSPCSGATGFAAPQLIAQAVVANP